MAEAITTTILEDVVVLAIGRNTEGTNSSTPPQRPHRQRLALRAVRHSIGKPGAGPQTRTR